MERSQPFYIYGIDDKLPIALAFAYGVQWTLFLFPAILTVTALCAEAFKMSDESRVSFVQLTFITAGLFTLVQSLWGHRYPVIEGPSTAHLLTMLSLVPYGISSIQSGMILGSFIMILLGALGNVSFFSKVFTRNIVITILLLIALSLAPHLATSLSEAQNAYSKESQWVFFVFSSGIVIFTALCSYHLKGLWKTLSLLIGVTVGTVLYSIIGKLDFSIWEKASWVNFPSLWTPVSPQVSLISGVSFTIAYVAVLVNILGSLTAIASVTDRKRLNSSLRRSLILNGLSGIVCGVLSLVGLVSYSISPGVVTSQRIASRYAISACGIITIAMGFFPKVAAFFAFIPVSVVSAVLCMAMGNQIGAALQMVSSPPFTQRDGTIVGLSVMLGLIISILPTEIISSTPSIAQLFLKNGMLSGIIISLILEHGFFRKKSEVEKPNEQR
ncbi:MAG: purine/pyrimidine permease [Syntrophobacterales bacterium]|nr:purine/pyrimidine permease [Syntrophobacterales bacterium]